MIGLALRMLFGERAKYLLLLSGIASATVMMVLGMALWYGIQRLSSATADNIRSPIWVTDPMLQQVGDSQPLRATEVDRVRSVAGVRWAAPLYLGGAQVRLLEQGVSRTVLLVGLDATTLLGAPTRIVEGSLDDLRLPDAVFIDERGAAFLSADPQQPLKRGDSFEMNDRRAVIVGICRTDLTFFGGNAYIFSTFDRAVGYAASQRKMVTHILAVPEAGREAAEVARAIHDATGLQAFTEDGIKQATWDWMLETNVAPFVISIIVVVGFVVGTLITGQAFYSFVLENSRYFGALRAMGAETRALAGMILAQAAFVGVVGFGLGAGLIGAALWLAPEGRSPALILWQVPVSVFAAITGICLFAALLGLWRVVKLEPAVVFRG
ncbi:MAG: ABC transporter permease [Candidatus Accumulibacter sp.]|jgi:putative ABC transport system permease protein|nr:ABC transporter permease [Accumulibacter sp.]